MNDVAKNLILWVVIAVVLLSVFQNFGNRETSGRSMIYSEFLSQVKSGQISEVLIEGQQITGKLISGSTFSTYSPETNNSPLIGDLDKAGVQIMSKPPEQPSLLAHMFISWFPFIVLIGLWFFFMRQMQGGGGGRGAMSFGKSKARLLGEDQINVTFSDVAGVDEAKEEVAELVEFLSDPSKFQKLGGKIPRGVLMVGSPGTGKTLLAKAIAGEAKVPFFTISGSEFVEMFVGVGASRVRDLFKKAKKASPCIIFIDEIDAVGRQRGAGLGGSHDEREQTLNQILVEMDGFDNQTNVIVLAATNRPDVLDPALLRPGRFDRQVVIDLPDIKDREAILKIHAQKKPLDKDVDLKIVAQRTPGFSGADLANLLNEAAIMSARDNKKTINNLAVLDSIERVLLGRERKSHILSDEEKKITAYHEAGHALIAHVLPKADPVHKVSIISRGRAAGYTINLPKEDKKMTAYSDFIASMAVLLGGYAAEKTFFGEVTTGASNDLQRATATARKMVTQFGMDEKLGPRTFGQKDEMPFLGKEIHERRDYSEKTAQTIDEEISNYVDNALKTAEKTIKDNKDKMEKIVAVLIDKETIEKDEFNKLLA